MLVWNFTSTGSSTTPFTLLAYISSVHIISRRACLIANLSRLEGEHGAGEDLEA